MTQLQTVLIRENGFKLEVSGYFEPVDLEHGNIQEQEIVLK